MSDAPPIGVALIGSGIFVREQHLDAILNTPSLELKAVYSRKLESAAKLTSHLAQKVDFYSDETADDGRGYDDLLKNTNIKGVIIALPILVQPGYVRKALEAGKDVLSEKPIAADSKTAAELLGWYVANKDALRSTWSVAENWRFVDSHVFAAGEVRSLGKVLSFRVRHEKATREGDEYYETAWRKHPEYQGGFILDAGIHDIAAMRLLLGPADEASRVSAFSSQLQKHLPPVDTLQAIVKTKSGITGSISYSFAAPLNVRAYLIVCERGVVTVTGDTVTTMTNDSESTENHTGQGVGVQQEVDCWKQSILSGDQDPRLVPEEALKDLQVLEALLRSGEQNGTPVDINL